ncbi:MAG: HAMP domain-containing histidine kinase [Clostridia bacterium]|nr:HAMP domain-containing histidine kinase [Clostridia bacterium]
MRHKRNKFSAFLGYVVLLLLITVTVMFAVLIYDAVDGASEGDTRVISITMLFVIIALSLICTLADVLRRKFTVDKATDQILEATERMTSGDFSVRLKPRHSYRRYDEFDIIMENLNLMAAELSKNEVLKTDFISNVSHEIKTPLAIIRNYSVSLKRDDMSAEERKRCVETLENATARLDDLVMNILRLNKLENQSIMPENTEVKLDELLAEAVLSFEELIEKKNLELECDFDELRAVTSPSHLELIWNNLLSNAIKFTPEGGKISVTLKGAGRDAVITVKDSGCGISAETGKHIFDKFYQGDTSHAGEGNGLGLALVKKVVDILGGEIGVESEVGKGSTFTVTLKGAVCEER